MIRPAAEADREAIWAILEPLIRRGEVFTLPRDMTREDGLAYWFAPRNHVFVFEHDSKVAGSYLLRPNQLGGGAHVGNCAYMTADWATGQGIAAAMCAHSVDFARRAGFRALQFNFVVSTNAAAVYLWQKHGFRVLTTLPGAFQHPEFGYVDALVLWRDL